MKNLLTLLRLTLLWLTMFVLTFASTLAPSAFAQTNSTPATAPATHAAPPPPAVADPSSQKARQLLDQMIAALGGQAWLTYKTTEQQGRSYTFYQGKSTSAGVLYWRFYEYPDKERRELTKQRDVVYIYS